MSGELGPKHWNYMGNGTDDANKDAGSALNEGVNSLINKKHNSNKENSKKKKNLGLEIQELSDYTDDKNNNFHFNP